MIQHHHERLDGSGFPEGLKDDGISWEGKILAIVDHYDALVSGMHSQQPPLSPQDALVRIKQGKGTLFDPELVDVFVDVMTHKHSS